MNRTTTLSPHPDRFKPTMTSLEEVDFINAHRQELASACGAAFPSKGFAKLEHKDFLEKVTVVLGPETSAEFSADLPDRYGRPRAGYRFPKREACLMASREIAELVESNHADVKRSIDRMASKGVIPIPPLAGYLDALGRTGQTEYLLDKRSSYIIVAQLSPEFTARLVDRWQELEAQSVKPAFALPDFTNPAAAARAWADAVEATQALAIERDHAIATKAQIGSKREATAMATASAANCKAEKLMDQLGFNARHATVIAVEGALGKKFGKQDWRPLKAWCKDNGASSVTVPCARYGKAQAWPAGAWGAVYGVDLVDLFGAGVQQ